MTTIVSAKCTDGVVIGIDSAETLKLGSVSGENSVCKLVYDKEKSIIATIAGDEILSTKFEQVVLNANFNTKNGNDLVTKLVYEQLMTEGYGQLPFDININNFVGYIDENGDIQCAEYNRNLISVKMNEEEWFKTAGAGMDQTLPLMNLFAKVMSPDGMPNVKLAKNLLYWVLKQAVDSSSDIIEEPIKLAIIERDSYNETKTDFFDFDEPDFYDEYEMQLESVFNALIQLDKKLSDTTNVAENVK